MSLARRALSDSGRMESDAGRTILARLRLPAVLRAEDCCLASRARYMSGSISAGSSSGARELFTRRDTGQRCRTSFAASLSKVVPPKLSRGEVSALKDDWHAVVNFRGEVGSARATAAARERLNHARAAHFWGAAV
jgi:hypothetical protein